MDLERITMFIRIAGSLKEDIKDGCTEKALGKLEILEGELGIVRKDFVSEQEKNKIEVIEEGNL